MADFNTLLQVINNGNGVNTKVLFSSENQKLRVIWGEVVEEGAPKTETKKPLALTIGDKFVGINRAMCELTVHCVGIKPMLILQDGGEFERAAQEIERQFSLKNTIKIRR